MFSQDGSSLVDGIIEIPLAGQTITAAGTPDGDPKPGGGLRPFLVGPENRLVATAIRSILDGRVAEYNPIVLYGPTGVGKSHLARGSAANWRGKSPTRRVVITSARHFAREFSDAMETQAVDDFRLRYRRARLLVFEDLDGLGRHGAVQEELVNTFDTLLAAGRQILATASTAPAALPGILPALQSRLTGGLAVALCPPSLATRVAALCRLAKLSGVKLTQPVARVLCEGLSATMSELEGALNQLAERARLNGGTIGMDAARRYLAARPAATPPGLREIASATARCFSLKLSELRSPSRRRAVVTARGVAMYLARQLAGESLEQIGQYFSGRDHSTVMHSCRKTEALLKTDPAIREAVQRLQKRWQMA